MKYLRWFIIGFSIVFIAACGADPIQDGEQQQSEQGVSNHVGNFTAVTQADEAFNVTDLEGHWWVADFIFTNCTTVCLPMTANMGKLQDMLEEEELDDVKLVSFSVDPEYDTPEVLTEYAAENDADLDRWTFLTGYDFETIEQYSIDTFKNWVAPPPEGDDQVEHGTSFFLIDPEGNIVSHYSGTKVEQMDDIIEEIKQLK